MASQGFPAALPVVTAIADQGITRICQCSKIAGDGGFGSVVGAEQHRGKARMGAEGQHFLAERCQVFFCIKRAEALQQILRRGEGAARRRIDKAQGCAAPGGKFKCETSEIDIGNLRCARHIEPLRFRPQPITPALGYPACAAGTLIGRGL